LSLSGWNKLLKVSKQDGHHMKVLCKLIYSERANVDRFGRPMLRFYETKISIKGFGYLIGKGKNDKQPQIVIRENAVDVKTPRERVVLGDEPDWGPIGILKENIGLNHSFVFSGNKLLFIRDF
jgi:hypothetical protein